MLKYLILLIISVSIIFYPVSAELIQFWPDSNSISTADVRDICDGTNGKIIFATSNGISVYNNEEWEILHALPKDRRGYLEGIPLNDYVLELEYDYLNNLWIGYSNGIQIYNGYSKPVTIRQTDEILSDVGINKLKRQGRIMWIATGDSGIYYYYNGIFSWIEPGTATGLLGNHINDIEVDYSNDRLYLATALKGQYIYEDGAEGLGNITFKKLEDPLITNDMGEIVSYPSGGVVFFNSTGVVYYNEFFGGEQVFNVKDLSEDTNKITAIAITKSGKYVIGTDNGIFCWYKGEICKHLTRFEGLADNYIETVYIDEYGRWWFTTKETAGYYLDPEFIAVSAIEIDPDSFKTGATIINNVISGL